MKPKNPTEVLTCPKCGEQIALEQALAHRIDNIVNTRTIKIIADKKAEIAEIKAEYRESLQAQLQKQEEATADRVAALNEKTAQLEVKLQQATDQIDQEVTNRLAAERKVLQQQAEDNAHEVVRLKLIDRDNEISELKCSQRRMEADHKLRDADKDQVINTLKADFERMKQKMEQGPIQRQGESLEVVFESQLAQAFHCDGIEPIGKGVPGADNLQHVRTTTGARCGIILWETKRAQSGWSNEWLDKLKRDQRSGKADVAVIVCTPSCLPKGLHGFGYYRGVLVCEHSYAIALAAILRERLAAEAQIRAQQANGTEQKEQLHTFVCSDFHQQVVVVVESIVTQLDQLAKEKVSTQNKWASRERQINAAMAAIAKLYGGVQSIVGSGTLPNLPTLMLEAKANPKLL